MTYRKRKNSLYLLLPSNGPALSDPATLYTTYLPFNRVGSIKPKSALALSFWNWRTRKFFIPSLNMTANLLSWLPRWTKSFPTAGAFLWPLSVPAFVFVSSTIAFEPLLPLLMMLLPPIVLLLWSYNSLFVFCIICLDRSLSPLTPDLIDFGVVLRCIASL